MASVQSGSVHNAIPASGGSFGKNLASPAGSVHVPLSSAVQPLGSGQVAPKLQTLSIHMRPSSAQVHEPQLQPAATTAPAAVMQHGPPSSRAGSMHQQRQLASIGAVEHSGEKQDDAAPARITSLAVSVANTMNVQARPTSTQEGAETPIPASDDDTIEMQAQGWEGARNGRSKRLRSSGGAAVASGTPGAGGEADVVAQRVPKPQVAAQSNMEKPVDTSAAAPSAPSPAGKKPRQDAEAAAHAATGVTRRPATRSLAQKAAMLAQDAKAQTGIQSTDAAKKAEGSPGLESAFLADSPARAGQREMNQAAATNAATAATAARAPNSTCANALEGAAQHPYGDLQLGTVVKNTGSSELQTPHNQAHNEPLQGPDLYCGECRSQEGQQHAAQQAARHAHHAQHAACRAHSPPAAAPNLYSRDQTLKAANMRGDVRSPSAGEAVEERVDQPASARRSRRAKSETVSAAAPAVSASPAAGVAATAHNHNHNQAYTHNHTQHQQGISNEGHGSMQLVHSPCAHHPDNVAAGESVIHQCVPATADMVGEGLGMAEAAADCREAVAEVGLPVAEAEPEPQPAACTVPLQPPLITSPRERDGGPRTSRRSPARHVSEGVAPYANGFREEVVDAHNGGPRRLQEDEEEEFGEVQQDAGAAKDMDVPGGGRADAVIMQARGDDGEEEVQAKGKGGHGTASSCEAPGPCHHPTRGIASCEQPGSANAEPHEHEPVPESSGGAAMRAAAAAAVSGTLGRAALDKPWRGPSVSAPPQVSESGSGNAGQRDLCDNESEAFQGSAGAVHEVPDRAHSSGVPGLPERREGVGEVMGHRMSTGNDAHIPREEGEGEVGAASREASRGQADSVLTPSGYHADSLQLQHAHGVVEVHHAASRAATGGPPPMPFVTTSAAAQRTARAAGARDSAPIWWEHCTAAVVAAVQGEGEGEIAGPVFRDCGGSGSGRGGGGRAATPQAHAATSLPAAEGPRPEEHLSRACGASERDHHNMHEAGGANDVADSGQKRNHPHETVVESTLHAPADSLQPTGSRTGDALPQMLDKVATRAISGAGANFSAAEDVHMHHGRDTGTHTRREHRIHTPQDTQMQPPYPAIAYQASVNLARVQPHSSGGRECSQPPAAGLNLDLRGHTLSRVGSVENVPLESSGLAVALAAAAERCGEATEPATVSAAPLLQNGVTLRNAEQLKARTSGCGGDVSASMHMDRTDSTAVPNVCEPSQLNASHSPNMFDATQQLANPVSSYPPNNLFPLLPLTAPTIPPHLTGAPTFMFTAPQNPPTCNAPSPSLLFDSYNAILSSLLPQQRLPCNPAAAAAAALPYTAATAAAVTAAACTAAPATYSAPGAAAVTAAATAAAPAPARPSLSPPPHLPDSTMPLNAPPDIKLSPRSSNSLQAAPQGSVPESQRNGMHDVHARSSTNGISPSPSAPVAALPHTAAAAGLPPMSPALPNGILNPNRVTSGAISNGLQAANGVIRNGVGSKNTSELPRLLHRLPGHLQAWLQDLCKEDARAGQLLQALHAASTTERAAAVNVQPTPLGHPGTATAPSPTRPHAPHLVPDAPVAVYPASLLHAVHFNSSNQSNMNPAAQLASQLLAGVSSNPMHAATASPPRTHVAHDKQPQNSVPNGTIGAENGMHVGLKESALSATQPLATLLHALGSTASPDVLRAVLPNGVWPLGAATTPPSEGTKPKVAEQSPFAQHTQQHPQANGVTRGASPAIAPALLDLAMSNPTGAKAKGAVSPAAALSPRHEPIGLHMKRCAASRSSTKRPRSGAAPTHMHADSQSASAAAHNLQHHPQSQNHDAADANASNISTPAAPASKRHRASTRNSLAINEAPVATAAAQVTTGAPAPNGVVSATQNTTQGTQFRQLNFVPAAHNLTALIGSSKPPTPPPPRAPAFSSPHVSPSGGHTQSAAHGAARHAARNASATKPGAPPQGTPPQPFLSSCPTPPAATTASPPKTTANAAAPQAPGSDPPASAEQSGTPPSASAADTAAAAVGNSLTDVMAALLDLRSTKTGGAAAAAVGDTSANTNTVSNASNKDKAGGNSNPEQALGDASGTGQGTALTPTQHAVLERRLAALFESLRMDPVALQQALQVALFNSSSSS